MPGRCEPTGSGGFLVGVGAIGLWLLGGGMGVGFFLLYGCCVMLGDGWYTELLSVCGILLV